MFCSTIWEPFPESLYIEVFFSRLFTLCLTFYEKSYDNKESDLDFWQKKVVLWRYFVKKENTVLESLEFPLGIVFRSGCQFIEIGQATPIPVWYREENFSISNDYIKNKWKCRFMIYCFLNSFHPAGLFLCLLKILKAHSQVWDNFWQLKVL